MNGERGCARRHLTHRTEIVLRFLKSTDYIQASIKLYNNRAPLVFKSVVDETSRNVGGGTAH